jgi:hypothetical protein
MGSKGYKVVYVDQPQSGHKSKSHHHSQNSSDSAQAASIAPAGALTTSTTTSSSSSSWSSSSNSTKSTGLVTAYVNGEASGGTGGVCTASTLPSSSIVQGLTTQPLSHDDFFKLTSNLPNFGEINIENILLPENCFIEDLRKFEDLYKNHCEVSVVRPLNKHDPKTQF